MGRCARPLLSRPAFLATCPHFDPDYISRLSLGIA